VGKVFVGIFDCMLGIRFSGYSSLCEFAPRCGTALVLEHTGELFACDHFVDPAHALGKLGGRPLGELAGRAAQRDFGARKERDLPGRCRKCDQLPACNGGCPKDRLLREPGETAPLNYLCPGYRMFFRHIDPAMRIMAELLVRGLPPSAIMEKATVSGGD